MLDITQNIIKCGGWGEERDGRKGRERERDRVKREVGELKGVREFVSKGISPHTHIWGLQAEI